MPSAATDRYGNLDIDGDLQLKEGKTVRVDGVEVALNIPVLTSTNPQSLINNSDDAFIPVDLPAVSRKTVIALSGAGTNGSVLVMAEVTATVGVDFLAGSDLASFRANIVDYLNGQSVYVMNVFAEGNNVAILFNPGVAQNTQPVSFNDPSVLNIGDEVTGSDRANWKVSFADLRTAILG